SPDASERTESMRYDGQQRRVEIAPKVKLDVVVEPLAGGIVLRPPALRYGETLPLVVWITPHLYAWSDARGALLQRDRLACVIVTKQPDDAFWQAVRAVPWIDAAKPLVQSAPECRQRNQRKSRRSGSTTRRCSSPSSSSTSPASSSSRPSRSPPG